MEGEGLEHFDVTVAGLFRVLDAGVQSTDQFELFLDQYTHGTGFFEVGESFDFFDEPLLMSAAELPSKGKRPASIA